MPDPDKLTSEEEIAQNKGKVLKALLEHGELTRKEIALKTDLMRGYPNGEFPAVSPLVNELEKENLIELCTTDGCEERRVKRELEKIKVDPNKRDKYARLGIPGPKPKIWIINQDISAINKIFNTYPTLQDSLWEQEWVRDLIIKNRLDTRGLEGIEGIEELKKMLKLSPHFFKLCVNYEDLYGLTLEWDYYLHASPIELSPREIANKLKKCPDLPYAHSHITSYCNLFAFCYFMDEFDGRKEDLGYKIVERYTRERSHKMQESRRSEILLAIEKVLIPTMKLFFDNIDDKSFGTLNLENPDVMEKIRDNVQEYTTLSNRMKRIRNEPDWEEKFNLFYDDREAIFLEILDALKRMEIIKNY